MNRHLALLLALMLAIPAGAQTYNLQGFVKNARGAGVGGVTIDLYDPVANTRAAAAQNVTLANGQFNALFTPTNPAQTTFYVDFAPVAGTGLAAVQLKDQHFTATTVTMPDTILPDAVALTVRVFDSGAVPQPNVDLDVYDATTGSKIYTPRSTTSALGTVTVDVPPGFDDLLLTPPRSGPLAVGGVFGRMITTATTIDVTLLAGSSLSGTVTDSIGTPLDRAPITISDPVSGRVLATRYNSALGAFSFFLMPGTYDVSVDPPSGLDLLPVTTTAVVPGPALAIVLPSAGVVTGRVVDGGGRALYGARLAFADSATGTGVAASRARTDSTGAFRVALPTGTFDVTVSPPPGTALIDRLLPHVAVAGATTDLGTITLSSGFVLTGRVIGAGSPVADVNVGASDARTGARVPTSRDHSDAAGNFRLVLPAGTFDLDFAPPAGSPWLDAVRSAVSVSANAALPSDVVLTAAPARVTATVQGAGAGPLAGAVLRLLDASGADVPLSHRTTGSTGGVDFVAPVGSFTLRVLPPVASSWLPLEQAVTIAAPATSLGTLTLQRGVVLGGFVKSATTLAPIDDVNVNLFDPATGVQVLTSDDHSNFAGWFDLAIAPGTYDVELLPPMGTRFVPRRLASVTVPATGLTLPDTLLDDGILASGRTVDSATLAPIAGVTIAFTDPATGAAALAAHDVTAFDGTFESALAAGTYDVIAEPASGSRYAAAELSGVSLASDTNLGDIALTSGFFVGGTVRDAAAQPVAGVVVTVVRSGSGTRVVVLHDVSDAAGVVAGMVLPAGTYDLTFTPPAGSPLTAQIITNVTVSGDDPALFAVVLQSFSVTSVSPATGPATGGVPVQVLGTGFTGGAPTVTFGGMPLVGAAIASPTLITGTLPQHPSGVVDVVVTLSGGASATLPAGFTFTSANPPIIHVTRSGNDVIVTWAPTGASTYSAWRSFDPSSFGPADLVTTTTATSLTFGSEIGDGRLVFHVIE